MLKAENIPDEVVRALWEVTGEEPVGVLACLVDAKMYLAAAINAWPGMEADRILRARNDGSAVAEPRVILPLPQETRNE